MGHLKLNSGPLTGEPLVGSGTKPECRLFARAVSEGQWYADALCGRGECRLLAQG